MPADLPKPDVLAAKAAIAHAKAVRKAHARKTNPGDMQRAADLATAHERLLEAMKPIRSLIGGFPWGPQTDAAEKNRDTIYAISAELQAERRKLWKMRKRDQAVLSRGLPL